MITTIYYYSSPTSLYPTTHSLLPLESGAPGTPLAQGLRALQTGQGLVGALTSSSSRYEVQCFDFRYQPNAHILLLLYYVSLHRSLILLTIILLLIHLYSSSSCSLSSPHNSDMLGIDSPTIVEIESGVGVSAACETGTSSAPHMTTPTRPRPSQTNMLFGNSPVPGQALHGHGPGPLRDVAVVHPLSMTAEFKEVVGSVETSFESRVG